MFEDLTARLDQVFRNLRGIGKLTEANIRESLQDIRRVLLDADVNVGVARDFLNRVEEKAIGQEVVKSVLPAQLIIKIVYDEFIRLLGEKESRLAKFAAAAHRLYGGRIAGIRENDLLRQACSSFENQG